MKMFEISYLLNFVEISIRSLNKSHENHENNQYYLNNR